MAQRLTGGQQVLRTCSRSRLQYIPYQTRQRQTFLHRSHLQWQELSSRLYAAATEELQGADLDSWKAVQAQVESIGFSAEEAEKFLIKAFAWKKGYWGPEKREPEVPTTQQVQAVLDYLSELGIKDQDLHDAVKKFPEVLGMKVEERMKANVKKIEKEFKIKGPALEKIFKRKPQVLGFNWDCYGDCEGNCPRCWTHF